MVTGEEPNGTDFLDASFQKSAFDILKSNLSNKIDRDISAEWVKIDELGQLTAKTEAVLKKGDFIRGIVFQGHGDSDYFLLTKELFYPGDAIARAVIDLLNKVPASKEFFLGLDACKLACPMKNGKNFYESTLDEFAQSEETKPKNIETIHVFGHVHTSAASNTKSNSFLAGIVAKIGYKKLQRFASVLYRNNLKDALVFGSIGFSGVVVAFTTSKLLLPSAEMLSNAIIHTGGFLVISYLVTAAVTHEFLSRVIRFATLKRSANDSFVIEKEVIGDRAEIFLPKLNACETTQINTRLLSHSEN